MKKSQKSVALTFLALSFFSKNLPALEKPKRNRGLSLCQTQMFFICG
ncbi:hypothetical protein [Psychrobacillus insolitus]|nr:hypothetical protein [Psychrobacillus insolitus]